MVYFFKYSLPYTVLYFISLGLFYTYFFFSNYGWSKIIFPRDIKLLYIKGFLFIIQDRKISAKRFFSWSCSLYTIFTDNFFMLNRGDMTLVSVKGLGCSWFFNNEKLVFLLGFSHFIWVKLSKYVRLTLSSTQFTNLPLSLYCFNKNTLTLYGAQLEKLRVHSRYELKGVYNNANLPVLKKTMVGKK